MILLHIKGESSEGRVPRIGPSEISIRNYGRKMERTKEIMKKGSEKQERNHNRSIMETKKASFSRREKPTQLNGKVRSCNMRTEKCPLSWASQK